MVAEPGARPEGADRSAGLGAGGEQMGDGADPSDEPLRGSLIALI